MSDSDRVSLAYKAQSTFGTLATGTFKNIRLTGESLIKETTTVTSAELTPDRQITDEIRTNIRGSGDINGEFSYGVYDDFILAAIASAGFASSSAQTPVAFAIATSGDNYTLTRASGSWTLSGGLAVGNWIRLYGSSGSDTVGKVVALSSTVITVSNCVMTPAAGGPLITIVPAEMAVNGVAIPWFTIEKQFTDLSNKWSLFDSFAVDSWTLNVSTSGILTTTFSFIGKTMTNIATVHASAYTAAPENSVMNSVDNVTGVFENGLSIGLTTFNLSVSANLREKNKIGQLGPFGVGGGKVQVSGSLEGYFEDFTQLTKYVDFTSTSLAICFKDTEQNMYVIDMPKVKFTTGSNSAGGQNSDIMQPLEFKAMKHPTEDITIRVCRFPLYTPP